MSDTHLGIDHSDLVRAMRDVNRPKDAEPPITQKSLNEAVAMLVSGRISLET